jgi:hemin uptake protein HemP
MMGLVKLCLRIVDEHNENYYRRSVDKIKPRPATSPEPPKVKSEILLGKARALVITHNGRDYQLRVTQNGKLILTA